jgi:hypothetical protein
LAQNFKASVSSAQEEGDGGVIPAVQERMRKHVEAGNKLIIAGRDVVPIPSTIEESPGGRLRVVRRATREEFMFNAPIEDFQYAVAHKAPFYYEVVMIPEIRWSSRGSCGNSGCKDPECGCSVCGLPIGVAEDDHRLESHPDYCDGCELCQDQVPFILFQGDGEGMEQAQFHTVCFNRLVELGEINLNLGAHQGGRSVRKEP